MPKAIAEAVTRPSMRFVPIKTQEQQDIQSLHRVRERAIRNRTAVINEIRGLLLEYGIAIPRNPTHVGRRVPELLEAQEQRLSTAFKALLAELYEEYQHQSGRIQELDQRVHEISRQSELCQRLEKIPGVGPMTSTAILAAAGNGHAFRSGRQFSAWLGLVPRQHSSGGKSRLGGISKRGDRYLRTLLIHGARAVVRTAARKSDARSAWVRSIEQRRSHNKACVALANKNARVIWRLIARGEHYRPSA